MSGYYKNLWAFVTECNLELNLQELKRFLFYLLELDLKTIQIWVLFFSKAIQNMNTFCMHKTRLWHKVQP